MAAYIGNKANDEFHTTKKPIPGDCNQEDIKPENKVYFNPDTKAEAIRQGYSPCGKCKP